MLPVFVFEPDLISLADYSAMHVNAWQQTLQDLRSRLLRMGSNVYVVSGEVLQVFSALHNKTGFELIVSHEETGNDWTFKRDQRVTLWSQQHNVNWIETHQNGVVRRLKSRDDRQPIIQQRLFDAPVVATPTEIPLPDPVHTVCSTQAIPHYQQFFQPEDYANIRFEALQVVSETQAHQDLQAFLTQRGIAYSGGISSPNTAFEAGSRLSPHLAWGTISLPTVFNATYDAQLRHHAGADSDSKQWGKSLRAFSSRLHWHDHFIQRLESEPSMEYRPINPAYTGLVYEDNPEKLNAWTFGYTGFPLIDACMRCLQATGFMNFRMRAMIVSFAIYGLHLSWRIIHPPLAKIFLDYEPGIHLSQLQMQAGVVGINTIRVYSPTKQIIDQDPDCVFIKRWISELSTFHSSDIIAYEMATLGSYPRPIVDFKTETARWK